MMEAGPGGFSLVASLALVIMLCGTTAMLTLVVKHPEGQGPQFWAPAYMLTMASTVVLLVRPPLHDPVVAMIGSAGFVLSYMLLLIGYARFLHRPPPWWLAIAVLLVHFAALTWFTLIAPQPGMRVGVNSLAVALFAGITCYTLLREMRGELFYSQTFLASAFGIAAAIALIRSLLAFLGLLPGGGFAEGPLGEAAYLVPATHLLLVAGGTGMMLFQRRRQPLSGPASDAGLLRPDPASPSAADARLPR